MNGTIAFQVRQFSRIPLDDVPKMSEAKKIGDMHFWVEVIHTSVDGTETMGVFLHCRSESSEKNWACFADIEFCLVPQRKIPQSITWQHVDVFTADNEAVGFADFDGWNEIKDPGFGFIYNDMVQIEIKIRDMVSFKIIDVLQPISEGRPKNNSSLEDFSYDLLNNPYMSDVAFTIDGQTRIHAHRFILASKSRQLYETLFESLKDHREVKYDNVDSDAFLSVLSFFYRRELVLTESNGRDILEVASRFRIDPVISICKKYLADEDPFSLWAAARCDEDKDLEDLAEKKICREFDTLSRTDEFLSITKDMLKTLLSKNKLRAKEVDVYRAAMRWAEAECKKKGISDPSGKNKRDVLGDLIFNIRFPCMSQADFSAGPAVDQILEPQELVNVFMTFSQTPGHASTFPTTPRSSV